MCREVPGSQGPHSLVGEMRGVRNMCDEDHLTPVELTKVPGAMSSCLILAGKIQEGTERCGFKLDFEGV